MRAIAARSPIASPVLDHPPCLRQLLIDEHAGTHLRCKPLLIDLATHDCSRLVMAWRRSAGFAARSNEKTPRQGALPGVSQFCEESPPFLRRPRGLLLWGLPRIDHSRSDQASERKVGISSSHGNPSSITRLSSPAVSRRPGAAPPGGQARRRPACLRRPTQCILRRRAQLPHSVAR